MVECSTLVDFNLVLEFDDWKLDKEGFKLLKWFLFDDKIPHAYLLLLKDLMEYEVIEEELKVLVVAIEITFGENGHPHVENRDAQLTMETGPRPIQTHHVLEIFLIGVSPSGDIFPDKPGNELLEDIIEK